MATLDPYAIPSIKQGGFGVAGAASRLASDDFGERSTPVPARLVAMETR